MPKYSLHVLVIFLILSSCKLKTKTELYLERGLDILSNKKEVNFSFGENIIVNEVGVIRDQKENKKTLVIRLDGPVNIDFLNDHMLGIEVQVVQNKNVTKKNFDFRPELISIKEYNYLIRVIDIPQDKINVMTLFFYRINDPGKQSVGEILKLNNIITYND
ncbi:MAG: hypothetical protein KJN70_01485 [Eudoraea sp.]|nr:hypothetical protein [Eudoraea sp.]